MRLSIPACIALLIVSFTAVPDKAEAQSISLGIDERQIFRSLNGRGYRGMQVVRRRPASIRVHACKGNTKYEVRVLLGGVIANERRIGECDLDLKDPDYAKQSRMEIGLREQGYEDIEIQQVRRGYRVTACRDGEQEIFFYSFEQNLQSRQRAGRCARRSISPKQAVQLLEGEGFTEIKILDDRRAPYRIEACKDRNKFEFLIGRRGRIRDRREIGDCRRPIRPEQLVEVLEDLGYDRVRILRDDRRPYLAEACKDRNLVELRIDRFGGIRNEERIGRCSAPLTEDDITARLAEEKYIVLGLKPARRGWLAEVCRGEAKLALRIGDRGRIRREEAIGKCISRSVLDVLKNLEDRGARRVNAFVEGCFRGDRFRWEFDRLGNRTGRERVGSC